MKFYKQQNLRVFHFFKNNITYFAWRFFTLANISTCPLEYCSITSLTSYGLLASYNRKARDTINTFLGIQPSGIYRTNVRGNLKETLSCVTPHEVEIK